MIKVNFLSQEHRCEGVKRDKLLGICDPEGEIPAYTTPLHGADKWNATIENPDCMDILFVPIDKNIPVLRPNGDKEETCDGMILYENSISFVELKDVRVPGWLSKAISQLERTIEIFCQNHNYKDFKKRRAFAANCRHPQFQCSCRERLQEFKNRTKFTLYPQARINIK